MRMAIIKLFSLVMHLVKNHIVTKFTSENTYQNQLYTLQHKDYETLFAQVYHSGRFQLLHLSFCAELPLFDLWFDESPIVYQC